MHFRLFDQMNNIIFKLTIIFFITLPLSACSFNASLESSFKLVSPTDIHQDIEWTFDEQSQNIAIRHLFRSDFSSAHLIRIQDKEEPHYHDRHDLTVTILSGVGRIHFQDKDISLAPGDVIFIPRGTYHWAENTAPNGSVVYAVFSPTFDGKDRRIADE